MDREKRYKRVGKYPVGIGMMPCLDSVVSEALTTTQTALLPELKVIFFTICQFLHYSLSGL